jgi:hypothetical protein
VCWQRTSGVWKAFVNGIASVTTFTNPAFVSPSVYLTLGIDVGWSSGNPFDSRYKFNGTIFQPMITAKAKYPANFVPATDLSVGASSDPVVFFAKPDTSGKIQDLASGVSLGLRGTGVASTLRYLA